MGGIITVQNKNLIDLEIAKSAQNRHFLATRNIGTFILNSSEVAPLLTCAFCFFRID
jgi:hypothetical protein